MCQLVCSVWPTAEAGEVGEQGRKLFESAGREICKTCMKGGKVRGCCAEGLQKGWPDCPEDL